MIKIRLMRIGAKKRPFYRVVVVDEQAKRTGGYIELLGTYNPLTNPKDIKLKQDRIDHWIKQGAQPSTGYLRIIGKAPQRLPQKPKKAAKTAPDKTEPEKVEPEVKEEKTKEAESNTPETAPEIAEETPAPEVKTDERPS